MPALSYLPLLLLALFTAAPLSLALPSVNPLSITPKVIPASGNVDIFISVPRADVDPHLSLFLAADSYSLSLLFLPGTVLPVPPRTRLQITVACTAKNLTHLMCMPPPFSNSEVAFQVTVLYLGGKSPLALLRSPNVPCVLQVSSHVTWRSAGRCRADGPCLLTYHGYGLNTDVNQYRCMLTTDSSGSSWVPPAFPHCIFVTISSGTGQRLLVGAGSLWRAAAGHMQIRRTGRSRGRRTERGAAVSSSSSCRPPAPHCNTLPLQVFLHQHARVCCSNCTRQHPSFSAFL